MLLKSPGNTKCNFKLDGQSFELLCFFYVSDQVTLGNWHRLLEHGDNNSTHSSLSAADLVTQLHRLQSACNWFGDKPHMLQFVQWI